MPAPPISEKDALAAASAMAKVLGLELIPEHRAGVALNLARLMAQAALVMSVALAISDTTRLGSTGNI